MIYTRIIRPTRIRSLISDTCYMFSWKLHHRYVTLKSFYWIMCGYRYRFLSLSVREPLISKNTRSYTSERERTCWKCNKLVKRNEFSCQNCGILQRPSSEMTYFQLMDVPETFDLDSDDISNKYKTLQKMFHPDKFVQKSQEEIDISDHYSRLVNKAYSTLKNPLSRGIYMLNLNGLSTDDDNIKMNQEFLMDILEKNEEVENMNDAKNLEEFQKANSKIILEYVSMASKAFQEKDLQEAREVLMKMKYFVNIENELKKKKSTMGIVD